MSFKLRVGDRVRILDGMGVGNIVSGTIVLNQEPTYAVRYDDGSTSPNYPQSQLEKVADVLPPIEDVLDAYDRIADQLVHTVGDEGLDAARADLWTVYRALRTLNTEEIVQ